VLTQVLLPVCTVSMNASAVNIVFSLIKQVAIGPGLSSALCTIIYDNYVAMQQLFLVNGH
jgi:hypothetical protein